MKSPLVFAAVLASLMLVAPSDSSANGIEKEMKVLKKTTRELGQLEGDFAKGEALAKEATEAVNKAKEIVPEVIEKIPDAAAKAAAIQEYKSQMEALAGGYVAVGKACADKDEAKLKEALDALYAMKKKGHEKFTEEDD